MTDQVQSLRIETGEIRLAINGDPSQIVAFNPRDVLFAEKMYALIQDLQDEQKKLKEKQVQLESVTERDVHGLPLNAVAILQMQKDVDGYIRSKIDNIFGAGTSQKAFGDVSCTVPISDSVPCAAEQFLAGVTPFIQSARKEKMSKYMAHPVGKTRRSRVR